jgi:hypothetical protein
LDALDGGFQVGVTVLEMADPPQLDRDPGHGAGRDRGHAERDGIGYAIPAGEHPPIVRFS